MRRAVLLYNPKSGGRHHRREALIERAAEVLRKAGVDVIAEPTTGPQSAGNQARQFIANGFDTVIACGGDGTVNDTLQGVVGTDAVLGVIPVGTANSLAQDLRLVDDPKRAAEQLLAATPSRIAVGKIEYRRKDSRESRFFTVAAGIGADAALFYKLNAEFKQKWGMAAYVAMSLRMWALERFHPFHVEFVESSSGENRREVVTQLLVVRIQNFGGVLNRLAPGADLRRDDFRLVLFKTANKLRYLRFACGRLINRDWTDPHIELVHASEMSCNPLSPKDIAQSPTIYAEADGENLGRLPVGIQSIPNALNLLIPKP